MDFKLLRSFKMVAELENISHAATAVGYAQSTITTQIQQLENELEVKLFERLGNRICLTEAGRTFLEYTEQILFTMDRAKENLKHANQPCGVLKIAGIHSLCASIMPCLVQEYKEKYPNVKIEIATGVIGDVLEQVKTGNVDVALYMDFAEAPKDVIVAFEQRNPLCFLCGPDNPLRYKTNLTLKDIEKEPFLVTEKECRYRKKFEQMFEARRLTPAIYFETGNTEIIKKFVENNIGIALLPEVAVRSEFKEGKLVKLDVAEKIEEPFIRLIYHKDKWLTAAITKFTELMRASLV